MWEKAGSDMRMPAASHRRGTPLPSRSSDQTRAAAALAFATAASCATARPATLSAPGTASAKPREIDWESTLLQQQDPRLGTGGRMKW